MPPVVRYCATPAGRVAYSVTGSGPPLLCDAGWVTHLGRQLELFGFGPFLAGLARRHTVIRYDKPGCGLSARDGADLSFEAQLAVALGRRRRRSGQPVQPVRRVAGRPGRGRDRRPAPGPGRGSRAVRHLRERRRPGSG